jgi:DNA (cytosine-5)-methyltransferase 1
MKPWRPARDIIDCSIKGRSIYDRKKPLAEATLARILVPSSSTGRSPSSSPCATT